MKLSTIQKRLPLWYESRRCYYLKSAPGRGKTSVVVDAPERLSSAFNMNLGLVTINGPLLTIADSVGYLIPKHFDGWSESIYTDPFWFRTSEGKRITEYDGGIIFIDEADKADPDVKKILGEAALSRRLGPHTLPDSWVVWMAGNRSIDRSGSTKELDHLINRRTEVELTDDLDGWTEWALPNGVSSTTIAWANHNPHILFEERPKEQGPWCTPRSAVEADRYLTLASKYNDGKVPTDTDIIEEVQGMIGPGGAAQLFAFFRLQEEMPKFEEIVASPTRAKCPDAPDAQMLVCFNLAHRTDADTIQPCITYMDRMPKEFATTFAVAACKQNPRMAINPAIRAWAKDNSALMAAMARFNQ